MLSEFSPKTLQHVIFLHLFPVCSSIRQTSAQSESISGRGCISDLLLFFFSFELHSLEEVLSRGPLLLSDLNRFEPEVRELVVRLLLFVEVDPWTQFFHYLIIQLSFSQLYTLHCQLLRFSSLAMLLLQM